MGSSVKVLSPTLVAVGAPNYKGRQGRVLVYEKSGDSFTKVGQLVGGTNEQLGDYHRLAGSGTSVVVGTRTGVVKRFDLDGATGNWIQIVKVQDTGYNTQLKSVATGSSSGSFVVGGNLQSVVYSLAV